MTTLLIIGGYGVFGSRIVAMLEQEPALTVLVAGRSLARATAFCSGRGGVAARLIPVELDRREPDQVLATYRPDLVVDASGPFQAYSGYEVVEACLAHGADYMDLADGAAFVGGIAAFDMRARAAGRSVLSGVSTFPVLTAAAVRGLADGMATVETIRGGVAPTPFAGVGENVVRAVAAYAGQPVPIRRGGATHMARPFTEQWRATVAPPGALPLHTTLFSLVDVPDLLAFATLYPGVRSVWMGAGPVPASLHRVLIACAWLVRLRMLRGLLPFAGLMHRATNGLRWGEHRGGLIVEAEGRDATGRTMRRSWHMVAEGEDGPLVPAMAVVALVRRRLAGRLPAPGARPALEELELADYDALFASRRIVAGIREDRPGAPLFARLLGPAWDRLAPEIRAMHEATGLATGRAVVERGRHPLARLVAWLVGFPAASADTPVEVRFSVGAGGERWVRGFAGRRFSSALSEGRGRAEGLVIERFGPLRFGIALVVDGATLRYVLRRWSVLGVPMPMTLCPHSNTYETVEEGRFRFHVEIGLPLTGLLVSYRGWLAPGVPPAAQPLGAEAPAMAA